MKHRDEVLHFLRITKCLVNRLSEKKHERQHHAVAVTANHTVRLKIVFTRSRNLIWAHPASETVPMSVWFTMALLVLSRQIVEQFLFRSLSAPGDRWCIEPFAPQAVSPAPLNPSHSWWLVCSPVSTHLLCYCWEAWSAVSDTLRHTKWGSRKDGVVQNRLISIYSRTSQLALVDAALVYRLMRILWGFVVVVVVVVVVVFGQAYTAEYFEVPENCYTDDLGLLWKLLCGSLQSTIAIPCLSCFRTDKKSPSSERVLISCWQRISRTDNSLENCSPFPSASLSCCVWSRCGPDVFFPSLFPRFCVPFLGMGISIDVWSPAHDPCRVGEIWCFCLDSWTSV